MLAGLPGMVAGTLILCEGAVTPACQTPSLQSPANVSDVVIFDPIPAGKDFPNGKITMFSDFDSADTPSRGETSDAADTRDFLSDDFKKMLIEPFIFFGETSEGTSQGLAPYT